MMSGPLRFDAVDATISRIDSPFLVADVTYLAIVPITYIDGSVRPHFDIHWPEPAIFARDHVAQVARLEGRLVRGDFTPDDSPLKRLNAK